MGDTSISWTDKTWNPIRGCSKVSAGCTNCYAERVAYRFSNAGQPYVGLIGIPCSSCSPPGAGCTSCRFSGWRNGNRRWNGTVMMVPEHFCDPLRWSKPVRVFVNSMSDLFHESLTADQIALVFVVMMFARRHTFQVLTKRARRMVDWFSWASRLSMPELIAVARAQISDPDDLKLFDRANAQLGSYTWPLPNVWIGVSVENQEAADERIPWLLRCPAAIRFLSCEPLLGRVDLTRLRGDGNATWRDSLDGRLHTGPAVLVDEPRLDWVIVGCESGPGSRRCDVDWLRALRDQCAAAGTAFFLKQAALSMIPNPDHDADISVIAEVDAKIGSKRKARGVIELPYLDGAQHAAFPEVP
jgi:protein gp37